MDRFLGPIYGIEHFGQALTGFDIRYDIGHYAHNDVVRDYVGSLSISRGEQDV
jgi:hypothetical protein